MLGQRMNAILKSGLILGGLLLLGMPTAARAVDVSDAGHFFSAETLEKANKAIAEIEKKAGHEIRIETHATVPADKVEAVSKMDRAARQGHHHRRGHGHRGIDVEGQISKTHAGFSSVSEKTV